MHGRFVDRIEVRGRLVENENWRTLEKGPRDRYTLTLPPGKLGATLTNDRVEAIGQRFR